MKLDAVMSELAERGWAVIDLPDPGPVQEARDRLLGSLRKHLPKLEDLADYHRHVADDSRHVEIMFELCQFYWEQQLASAIIAANLDIIRAMAGPDLDIQRRPFLRA